MLQTFKQKMMANSVESNGSQLLSSLMSDFWNSEDFFKKAIRGTDFFPSVNIGDKDECYEIEVSAPGRKTLKWPQTRGC
jgi:HSP20 family protein